MLIKSYQLKNVVIELVALVNTYNVLYNGKMVTFDDYREADSYFFDLVAHVVNRGM
jgi:hypothetical protein